MKLNRIIITYALFSAGVFLFGKVYTLFGHGVTSHWMSNAYLYLLGLGVLVFSLLKNFLPACETTQGFSIFYRTYNSGVAILINGMLLNGILDIAGGTSAYVSWFLYVGSGLIAIAAIMLAKIIISKLPLTSSLR